MVGITGALTAFAGVAALMLGNAGGRYAALDVINSFAPLLLALTCLGGASAIFVTRGRWRRASVLLLLAGLVAGGLRIVPEYLRPIPQAAAGARGQLRVLTYNVWRRNVDPAASVRVILAADADVVLLQEADRAFAPAIARLAARYPYRTPCGLGCGEVILSRRPFTSDRFEVTDEHGERVAPGLLFATTTAPDGGPLSLMTQHYVWPVAGLGQVGQRARLAAAVRLVDPRALILTGDMNLTPWAVAMRRQDAALAPLVRHSRGLFSWPGRLNGRRWPVPLLPIDQIYAGPGWAQLSVTRLPAAGSDHHPLLAVLARR